MISRLGMSQLACVGLLLMANTALASSRNGYVRVILDLQRNLGLETAPLVAERRAQQIEAFARVLDPGPLVALNSDLQVEVLKAESSKAEAARVKSLGTQSAAPASLASQAKARSDASRVSFLRERIGLEWGPGVTGLGDRGRKRLIRALVAGQAALVRVDSPANVGQARARTVEIHVGSEVARGIVLGPARVGEPSLRSSGLIVEVVGPAAALLSVGLRESAALDVGSPQNGVAIPRTAVVRYLGGDWAYIRHLDEQFERRSVQNGVTEQTSVFVASGFSPGERVVTRGALRLLEVELNRPSAR